MGVSPTADLRTAREKADISAQLSHVEWQRRFDPMTVLAWGPSGDVPLLDGRIPVGGVPAAYVCRGFVCEAPVTAVADLERQLAVRS